MNELKLEELKNNLLYSPETGYFTWLTRPAHRIQIGDRAGHLDKSDGPSSGYVRLRFRGKLYKAHRLAWFYMTREWPDGEVDHKNRKRDDNRWENLRVVTSSQNSLNNGGKCYCWYKPYQKWMVRGPKVNGRSEFVGYFDSEEEAAEEGRKVKVRVLGLVF